ncbi:imidazolonepropionase [Pseudochrobactrum sp. HB0163]|uniref:imidazolonepropionase n=1 Tax=Pseudochrobactrum sp. HB0163 TaxID=3450708 RepID=UPI003F6DEC26
MQDNTDSVTAPSTVPVLWRNARILSMSENVQGNSYMENGAILTSHGQIDYVGPENDLPLALKNNCKIIDCENRLMTPGLIDCHTHLIHAGNRAHEFELRLNGATYEEVARAGGGIISSVKNMRAASEDDLLRQALPRLDALIAEGITTVEIKSGYGLDTENEIKALRAARKLAEQRNIAVRTTFLGAHALPPEMNGDKQAYLDKIINDMLPRIAEEHLADAVDGFCENIAFLPDEIARVFDAAKTYNLPVKLHADQLSNLHGAALAASYQALSADHLEYTDQAGAEAMAKAGTVAVLLPGAYYFIRETQKPPVELFRAAGTKMALATDNNPGTSPLTSLLLTMNMGATLFRMTVDECIAGVTREAARALGILAQTGTLEAGKDADLAIWNVDRPAELVYHMGFNPLWKRVFKGRI